MAKGHFTYVPPAPETNPGEPPYTSMGQDQNFTLPTMVLAGTLLLSGVAGNAKLLAESESYNSAGLLLVAASILVAVMLAWNYITTLRSTLRQITRDKDSLKRQLAEIQATQEGDRRFATMSHELRTPLNGVIGMLGLLQETELTAEQKNYAGIAQTSSRNLLSLIDELLDRARAEATDITGGGGAEPGAIIENVTELLAPRAHGKDIVISSYISRKVPQRLPIRDLHLRQLLFNVAGNAIKFTESGSVAIEADVDDGKTLVLRISDTGIGMSQDELHRVFQPFTQANDQTQRRYGGTGLGLAISKKLVADMHGTLAVASEQGRGTHFTITLPLHQAGTPVAQATQQPLAGRSYALIMADSAALDHLAKNLEDAGAFASRLQSKGKPLSKALQSGSSVTGIICDCAAAKIVIRHLRLLQKTRKPVPQLWIMMTPEERRQNQNLLKSPATGYLVRPLRRATLVNQLTSRDAESLSRASARLRKLVTTAAKPQKWAPLRILLVDDTPVNTMVATAMLGKAGHALVSASSGAKALQILETDRAFDLVLLDIEMPELDGYATARAIRGAEAAQNLSPLPIVALTANARAEDEAQCLAAGMDGHLTKPLERQDLEEVLQQVVKRKVAGRAA